VLPLKKGFKWGEGRSPEVRTKGSVSASTLVYQFCVARGICTLCKRKYAMKNRRMCGKCVMINRAAQQKGRDRKDAQRKV
jgi:hypothetical protein